MPAPYTPLAVANFFVDRHGRGQGIEHMKLQKLVYCSHGWWLAFPQPNRLVAELPQVWKFGPVYPSLYRALKVFGRDPITLPQSRGPFEKVDLVEIGDQNVVQLLEWVWGRYGHLSSFALSDMTHKPSTAWYRAAKEQDFEIPDGLDIQERYIEEEFRGIFEGEHRKAADLISS